jgi:NADH:ubiquinone oxidoreductase subunit H
MSGALVCLLLLAGCSNDPLQHEAPIRDVRPTKLQKGEKVLVEANGMIFRAGAPTTITFDKIADSTGHALTIEARATGPERVVADIDERVEKMVAGKHIEASSTVTVTQTVDGKPYVNQSDPRDAFQFDLFPHSLMRLAEGWADKAGVGGISEWLGMTAKPVQGGLQVSDVVTRFEPDEVVKKYDRPPLDGAISKEEAKQGGMPDAEFKRFDSNGDGVIALHELEDKKTDDGLAASAGLKVGDVITKAGGKPVASVAQLEAAWTDAGSSVPVEVVRNGATSTVQLPTAGRPESVPGWLILALVLALVAGIVALPVPVIGGLVVVWERKISAYMQSRLGPNRVGPGGWLQWLADGLKLLMKEDIVPADADPYLFKLSPFLAFLGLFLTFVVLPFSHVLIVSDLNIGLLFLLSVTSLVVVSIIMGGWSSNSKWSLLGGMRSAAQIISYELPASVALLSIATLTGSLSTQKIVEAQGAAPWDWFLFRNPFTFIAFFIWFISALAEGNRTPFDLPEAESELVSGYNTEYSGFRFALFPLVEWVNLFVIGAVAAMLFLGGWKVPLATNEMMEQHWWLDAAGFVIFLVKDIAIIFVIIWIRWTLPRFRVDQMMNLCWKYFIPASFVGFVGVLAWAWIMPPIAVTITKWAMFLVFGLGLGGWFLSRVMYNRSKYSDLVLNDALGRANL